MRTRGVIITGDCLEWLPEFDDAYFDSIVTDPPAGISFMGKDWDSDKGGRSEWITWMTSVMREALRVLKPGAHGLVWALPRTSHWTATALEDAGFEVRDVVTHLFGSGFPKSLDISKAIDKAAGVQGPITGKNPAYRSRQLEHDANWKTPMRPEHKHGPATDAAKRWAGFGTALKPASEHWILVRKLMRYLIKLVTPPGGLVLDPFAASGSTGVAALSERFNFTGIEQSQEYATIAENRLKRVAR